MIVHIALIVSLCSGISMTDVAKEKSRLEKQNPKATVTVRLDKKCLSTDQAE